MPKFPVTENELAESFMFAYEELAKFKINVQRSQRLLALYKEFSKQFPKDKSIFVTDLLRAAIVFLHASLEELLRSLIIAIAPYKSKDELDKIPLAGKSRSRQAEKFLLGSLVEHSNISVKELIKKSVKDHISNQTYNNRGDIVKACLLLGIPSTEYKKYLPKLEAMIRRRHQIVHRADKPIPEDQHWIRATSLSHRHVESWINNAVLFSGQATGYAAYTKLMHDHKSKKN